MNLEQIVRKARFEVDAIRADDSTSQLWTDEECRAAVNDAMDSAARILRLADSDILTKVIQSDDAEIAFLNEDYDPGSLTITSGTTEYTLPPDLVSIVNIIPITDGFDGVTFLPGKLSGRLFTEQRMIPSTDLHSVNNGIMTYMYTQYGSRTLKIAPIPKDTIEIEIHYRYRPNRLITYDTGTITVNNGETSVAGATGGWFTAGVRLPAELIGEAGPDVSLQKVYPRVASITADGSLTLATEWAESTLTNQTPFAVTMVPLLPEEHHLWLAKMAAAQMLRKINLDISEKAVARLEAQLLNEIQPEVTMRQVQESLPVEPFNP